MDRLKGLLNAIRGTSSPKPSPVPAPPAHPDTPVDKVQALATVFRTQWLPPATTFLNSPPSDPYLREKEFLRLSESIMSKIVLAADSIETDGDAEARNERKAVVRDAQRVLRDLDAARKP